MKKFYLLFIFFVLLVSNGLGQTNILSTDNAAEQIMLGNYNPATYMAFSTINHPDSISKGINTRVKPDSLHAYLDVLRTFKNRNTGTDTISMTDGIGAARKWIFKKFQQFSTQNQNRLIPSYLQFDLAICGINQHKNIFAVLPGTDTSDKSVVLVEAHLDSRCAGLCDTACLAEGMEDNGSGTALVLELARVMSKYSYKNSIVFMLTIAEEQGLLGAKAFSDYAVQKGIKIKAVLNNDVIGGIFCGHTSSPPVCPGFGNIDSTHVRMFSAGGFSSFHKGLARFIKLEYKELIKPIAAVEMTLHVMTPEDRTNRGGDHIPFRQANFTAMRFTSANENGNADVTNPGYSDRQHTSNDILGLDTNTDMVLDSFFVNFRYLARNAVINGNAAGMAAIGPRTPDFTMLSPNGQDIIITITQETQYLNYRVGLRTTTYDWDTVVTCVGATAFTLSNMPGNNYIASVASVDGNGVESLFSKELMVSTVTGLQHIVTPENPFNLLQNRPNPSDEATTIVVVADKSINHKEGYISIADLLGKEIKRIPVILKEGINEVEYSHGYHMSGTYIYTLIIDGKPRQSKKMVFIN
jgi:hypothetical protein